MNDHSKSSHIIRLLVGLFIALAFAVSVLILALPRLGVSLEELWAEDGAPESPDISAEASSVAEGAWRYMDAGAEPGVGALWTTGYYDAEDWKRGDAPFAERASGGGCQLLPDQSADGGGSPSFYFRREFQLDSLDNVFAISGTVRYSDAVLVYLNGEVIFAGNVPAGGFAAGTDLGCAADPGTVHEDSFLVTDLSALRVGENILAVELHQAAADGGSACFQMPYFNLLAEETQAPVPAPENIFLEMGDMGRQIWVDWLTEDAGYYELQYMTADEYEALEDKENGFSLYADRAFMGRTSDGERDCYLDRGPITDLKAGEEYLYRVAAVGSDTASELMRFTAPENNRYTFAVLGGALGPDETAAEMDAAAERAGRLDLLIAPRRLIDGGQAHPVPPDPAGGGRQLCLSGRADRHPGRTGDRPRPPGGVYPGGRGGGGSGLADRGRARAGGRPAAPGGPGGGPGHPSRAAGCAPGGDDRGRAAGPGCRGREPRRLRASAAGAPLDMVRASVI